MGAVQLLLLSILAASDILLLKVVWLVGLFEGF
jgi:hypothetical protein